MEAGVQVLNPCKTPLSVKGYFVVAVKWEVGRTVTRPCRERFHYRKVALMVRRLLTGRLKLW